MPPKIDTPIKQAPPNTAQVQTIARANSQTVIPTSILDPSEQCLFLVALFGLVEITKIWDTLLPIFVSDPDPTWTNEWRISGPGSVVAWTLSEVFAIYLVSMLRIPMLTPTLRQFILLALASLALNGSCWLLAEPSIVLKYINIVGTAALGGNWYWNWFYAIKSWYEPAHLEGVHKIRLLPYSTATLNPLSLSYCIPPDNPQPIYVPIVFNNSIPEEVTYISRALGTGHQTIEKVYRSQLKKSPARPPRLRITDGGDEEEEFDLGPEIDPLSALILQSGGKLTGQSKDIDPSTLPSVKPTDSLSLIPHNLAHSENVLFLTINKPSAIVLKKVVDKRGDKFHISPRREAIIIECPAGGQFVEEDNRKIITKKYKAAAPELRCIGEEELVQFQARGISPLKVGWEKKGGPKVDSGWIEGIEDESLTVIAEDEFPLTRHDRVSKTHTVSLRVNHDRPGIYTVSLTSVHDSLHNVYVPSGYSSQKSYKVISKPSVKFNCGLPFQLLQNKTISIPIELVLDGPIEQDLSITFLHTSPSGQLTERKIPITNKREQLVVSEAGIYRLLGIEGKCVGSVMEPSTCEVDIVPLPTMETSVATLHECAMDVGVTAAFDFIGQPPFRLAYTEHRKTGKPKNLAQVFNSHHGSIVLRPEQEGTYTYTFTSLSDRNYKSIALDKEPIKQTVHPLANVDVVKRIAKRTLWSCDGDEVDIDVEARGIPPLKLTYLKSFGISAENATVQIPLGRSRVSIPVPSSLASDSENSGRLSISLLSVEDGNGCVRKLETPGFEIDIKRIKPTARLAKVGREVITEGETVKVPLRLTGEAPWDVTYSLNGQETTLTVRDPNSQLSLKDMGVYRLVNVKDAHCAGRILSADFTFEIAYKPRPKMSLQESEMVSHVGTGPDNLYRHKDLCAGQEEQIALKFTGQGPFELSYRYTFEGKTTRQSLKSAQELGLLHLSTMPGRHRYDFVSVGDANYPKTDVASSLEHQVSARPSASFISSDIQSLCLDSQLETDVKVALRGVGPWKLSLSLRKPASTSTTLFNITTHSALWHLSLPYTLSDIGRYEISIMKVEDASGCEWFSEEYDLLKIGVEVVESARILSMDEKTDLCIGDSLDFLLEGKSPWTIEYSWLGKDHKVSSSAARFSRFAEKPGQFQVKSVALRGEQCKRDVSNMIRTVHPLPAARISSGEDDLHEGDEPAVFRVWFTGTAPFAFTYTRSEQVGSKYKVVDSQTITGIMEDSYAVSSSLPGDYQVISVSDRFCRYPPLSRSKE
ncbi:uncharacterized protein L203_105961 [Cryptococcus depauperatus CBS 7841]|uniref:Uncharacterized protein n=1 Tax=Cryptococcus depauperatus CBS 7841 TaxID=1295531 RepID=A0A1E3IUU8_9TREE|nr:hypothetical protein L203_00669 [Cryptococcus depauperatus CBS 7841]